MEDKLTAGLDAFRAEILPTYRKCGDLKYVSKQRLKSYLVKVPPRLLRTSVLLTISVRKMHPRLAAAMKHAGVSVTVTSVTDLVAFGIGVTSQLPALAAFCAYAACSVVVLFWGSRYCTKSIIYEGNSRASVLCCCGHHNNRDAV